MALNIPAIAQKLNRLAPAHRIGNLQAIRTRLKGLGRQPGTKIFDGKTITEEWACHYGGRTELQFNIGYVNDVEPYQLRFGVAFSFELSQTLPSIDVLVPKVKYFNDFILLNSDDFGDMRMWHYDDGRSADYMPGPISSDLIAPDVFVFLGNRQPAKNIDYQKVLDTFDRLLPLYKYVESRGKTDPVSFKKEGFDFKSGCTKKLPTAKASVAAKELDLDLRHTKLQETLHNKLAKQYGKSNVGTERPSGVGTKIDVVVRQGEDFWFYEIKTSLTARACLREALGQLLEYSFWPGAKEPTRYVVVGESPIDKEGAEYSSRLQKRFTMPIEYEQIIVP